MVAVDRWVHWITDQIGYQERYHNHKETMAWTATAFYIPGIIALQYWAVPDSKVWTTVIIVVAAFLVGAFLYMQFRMRWEAANTVEGLIRAITDLCGGTEPTQDNCVIESKKVWPKFVQDQIDKVDKEKPRTWKSFGTGFWHWVRLHWKKDELDPRWLTEIPSYIASFLVTVFAIASVWAN